MNMMSAIAFSGFVSSIRSTQPHLQYDDKMLLLHVTQNTGLGLQLAINKQIRPAGA
jgi:hypothetical protein